MEHRDTQDASLERSKKPWEWLRIALCWGADKDVEKPDRVIHLPPRSPSQRFATNKVVTAKYNLATFLPKNLFEQFRRVANFYFLVMLVLQFIPQIRAWPSSIAAVPLVIVLGATALKDVYEDLKRFKSDTEINRSSVEVLVHGAWVKTLWKSIQVGDVVRLHSDEDIPADILAISSSLTEGECYLETRNLDGETNLKTRLALKATCNITDAAELSKLVLTVHAEAPTSDMYYFGGNATLGDGKTVSLDIQSLLLRGCVIRNTPDVVGIVVYTGKDTKLVLNGGETPSKRTHIEKRMNPQILVIFAIQLVIAALTAGLQVYWDRTIHLTHETSIFPTFLDPNRNRALQCFLTFWTMLVITQNLVPIALYASVEIVKLVQAFFIQLDPGLKHQGTPCMTRSWNLSDDLGQIEFIFSDKTGTLTSNEMKFRQCSIGGVQYGHDIIRVTSNTQLNKHDMFLSQKHIALSPLSDPGSRPWRLEVAMLRIPPANAALFDYCDQIFDFVDAELAEDLVTTASSKDSIDPEVILWSDKNAPHSFFIRHFMRALALCHTVVSQQEEGGAKSNIHYNASSPDEAALVHASKNFGHVFISRARSMVEAVIEGVPCQVEILAEVPFDSDRKRMSVVLRSPEGMIFVYCKGADSVLLELIDPRNNAARVEKTRQQLNDFATRGLRTLAIGVRKLSQAEFSDWLSRYESAKAQMHDRAAAVSAVAAELERDFILVGATAIEDELQNGVPETIAQLLKAGMRVWMLTGDKMETAVNIARTCNLFPPLKTANTFVHYVSGAEIEAALTHADKAIAGKPTGRHFLVIDGKALHTALVPPLAATFIRVSSHCESVICCRVAPLQKAQVVRLMDNAKVGTGLTLAIGDGANDVSMIQTAHIGIGIAGNEGRQAVMASDYAIARFRFLARLLLVHGRWSYYRSAAMALTFFYKNFVFVLPLILYQIACGASAQMVYHYTYQMFFNLVFTSLAPIAVAIFDYELSDKSLLALPMLYKDGILRRRFTRKLFWLAILNGAWQGAICFMIPVIAVQLANESVVFTGHTFGIYDTGTVICFCVVLCVNLTIGMRVKTWNWVIHLAIWGSIVIFVLYHFLVGGVIPPTSDFTYDLGGVFYTVFGQPLMYFTVLLTVMVALGPLYIFLYLQPMYSPWDVDIIREQNRMEKPKKSRKQRQTGRTNQLAARFPVDTQHNREESSSSTSTTEVTV